MRTAKHYLMSIHDINRRKLCDIYDSENPVMGEAISPVLERTRGGDKSLSFEMYKTMLDGSLNPKCDFIQNEHQVRVVADGVTDWYSISEYSEKHAGKKISYSVSCVHVSEELKTKNLFGYFDEENGIDTCPNLITKALTGSGWTLSACDTLYEPDGETEKIRSFTADEKTGALSMVIDICNLFQAYPIFHGDDRTIEIHALNNHPSLSEVTYGKNISNLENKPDSSSLVTRLYVQGDYTDFGYVGIDDASQNETGLNFILNFDYYKEIGAFTDEHQAA